MMNNRRSIWCIILFLFFFCGVVGFSTSAGSTASADNRLYAELLEKYDREDLRQELMKNAEEIKVEYLDYDWSLNGK